MTTPTKIPASTPPIRFATRKCSLGVALVAASDKGICCILLGDDAAALRRDLKRRFPNAELVVGDRDFERSMAPAFDFLDAPNAKLTLPLDLGGTPFQRRVWQYLCRIPAGKTVSYTDIARRMGVPKSVRAVANACGANAIAIAVPCHRVVRSDGALSGYRWGVERKRALLTREAAV